MCHPIFSPLDSSSLPSLPFQTILDQTGTKHPRCCLLRNGLLVVARAEGLYDYTLDTRAGCSVFEGAKQQIAVLRRFLVVVRYRGSEPYQGRSGFYSTTVFNGIRVHFLPVSFSLQVTAETGNLGTPFSTIHVLDPRNRMSAACITIQVKSSEDRPPSSPTVAMSMFIKYG
jgi:hypothetical protein